MVDAAADLQTGLDGGSAWGLLVRPMLVSWLSLGGLTQNQIFSGRFLSLLGRLLNDRWSAPLAVFQAASQMPKHGPLAHSTCATPSAHLCLTRFPSVLDHVVSLSWWWFESKIRHLLDGGLYSRVTVGVGSLSVVHLHPSAVSIGGNFTP